MVNTCVSEVLEGVRQVAKAIVGWRGGLAMCAATLTRQRKPQKADKDFMLTWTVGSGCEMGRKKLASSQQQEQAQKQERKEERKKKKDSVKVEASLGS
jgi:hypothetical protein